MVPSLGAGLFIGNLNDVCGWLWNKTPYTRNIYREKKMDTYEQQAREWTHVCILSFAF